MEALIGFAIGYWAGTRDGKAGIEKAWQALDALTKSDEFKSLVGQGLSMGGGLLSKGMGAANGNAIGAVVMGIVTEKAGKIISGGLRAA
jgi:hypothetical protein